jgi:lysozyme family protein
VSEFLPALSFTLRNEGSAFVDDPLDHGHATRYGVTLRTLSSWLGRPATKTDIMALTPRAVAPIYETLYWRRAQCDRIGLQSLATMVFDCAVLCGHPVAIMLCEEAAGVPVSGNIGRGLQRLLTADMPASFRRRAETHFCLGYQEHLVRIASHQPLQRKWLNGWLIRVQRCWGVLSLAGREQRARERGLRGGVGKV